MPAIYGGGNEFGESRVLVDKFGTVDINSSVYYGGCIGHNGKIYFAPRKSSRVLEIDPDTKIFNYIGTDYGTTVTKWCGAALANNGEIYCSPYSASQVIKINPNAKTTTLIGNNFGSISVAGRWNGIALARNGKLYCPPFNDANQVLEIDPVNNTTKLIGSIYSGTQKWAGISLAPDGKLYCAPYDATQVLEIDPITGTTTLIGDVFSETDAKYEGIITAPNGKLYCIPNKNTQVLEIDPINKTTKLIGDKIAQGYLNGTVGQNGNIYSIAYTSSGILEINPFTSMVKRLLTDHPLLGSGFAGSVLAPNGKIYAVPYNGPNLLEVDIFPHTADYEKYLITQDLSNSLLTLNVAIIKNNSDYEPTEIAKWWSPDDPELVHRANQGDYTTNYPVFFYKMLVKNYSVSNNVITYTTKKDLTGKLNIYGTYVRNNITYYSVLGDPLNGKPYNL